MRSVEKTLARLARYQEKIDMLKDCQSEIAMEYIQEEAQRILTQYPELTSYCQGMGSWSFHDAWCSPVDKVDEVDLEHDSSIAMIFYEYDEDLHLSGIPLRISKDMNTGEFVIENDW